MEKQISFFDDLEELNDSDIQARSMGRIEWLEKNPSPASLIDGKVLDFEFDKDLRKFSSGDRIVIACEDYESAVTGKTHVAISRVKSKTDESIVLSKSLEGFSKKVKTYKLVFWNVPYPDDLIEQQSRDLDSLQEREQSLALKLSSPKMSKEATEITKKVQTGEITEEDAKQKLGEMALGSGNISADALAEFNKNTYLISIQRAEIYLGMPSGFLSLLDDLKGLPKRRFIEKFNFIVNGGEEKDAKKTSTNQEPLKLKQSELLTAQ